MSFINNIKNQTIKDIEILFILSKKNIVNYNIITNYSKIDKRIKFFFNKNEGILNDIFFLITKTKGKYILIMNNIEIFELDEIEKFYNFTKGKINNIFNFTTKNKNIVYLIKSKILKDIQDKDLNFYNLKNMINYINSLP